MFVVITPGLMEVPSCQGSPHNSGAVESYRFQAAFLGEREASAEGRSSVARCARILREV